MDKIVLLLSLLLATFSHIEGRSIKLTQVAAQTGTFICCETYAPTQTLFYCVIYNSPNFRYFDNSGTPKTFAPAATGLGVVEQRVAAVQASPTSPFPLGGWTLGDIFIGHAKGVVVKITNGTSVINPWITLPENEYARQTVFDRTGTVYDGDLIVSFTYSVYQVRSDGSYTKIVQSNAFKNYEGLDIVPVDPARYGPLSGTILIPQNPYPTSPYSYCCDNPTNIAAVSKTGAISFYNTGCYTDQIFFVHTYDNFYGIDYGTGKVFSSAWDDLKNQGLDGEIIAMCERWGYPGFSGLRRIYYDPNDAASPIKNEAITLTSDTPVGSSIWEHGCFSRGGSADVLPGGFSFCYYTSRDTISNNYLRAKQISKGILQNYGITATTPNTFSYPATGVPPAPAGTMTVSILQDYQNGFYLQVVNGQPTNGNAYLDLSIEFDGPHDPNMLVRIQNNRGDSYLWNNNADGKFVWRWTTGTTGVVIGPVGAITAMKHFSFTFTVNGVIGLTSASIVSNSTTDTFAMVNGTNFFLKRISCKCRNGIEGDDPLLKECESTFSNATCCTRDCRFLPATTLCGTPGSDPCASPSYCTARQGSCPPLPLAPACNCTFPFYGFNCTNVRCDALGTCGQCYNYTQCAWCCDGGTQACRTASTCQKSFPDTCQNCTGLCNTGTCDCGRCNCPPGLGGATCNYTVDCTGNPVIPPATPLTLDICGVCGGNGTTCIGCDGVPFGLTLDVCGVCGGNGSTCYDPCPGTDCESCTRADACGWCLADSKCYPKTQSCSGGLTLDCSLIFSPAVVIAASVSIALIVGLTVGAVVFLIFSAIGAKKGYDAYMRHKNDFSGANSNPMYKDEGRTGTNPFYNEMKNL